MRDTNMQFFDVLRFIVELRLCLLNGLFSLFFSIFGLLHIDLFPFLLLLLVPDFLCLQLLLSLTLEISTSNNISWPQKLKTALGPWWRNLTYYPLTASVLGHNLAICLDFRCRASLCLVASIMRSFSLSTRLISSWILDQSALVKTVVWRRSGSSIVSLGVSAGKTEKNEVTRVIVNM